MNAGFAALADLAATTTTDFFSAAIVVTWAPRGLMGASWSVAQYGAVPVVNVRTCAGRASGSESACHLIGSASLRWVGRFAFRRCGDRGPWLPLDDPGDGALTRPHRSWGQVLGRWGGFSTVVGNYYGN